MELPVEQVLTEKRHFMVLLDTFLSQESRTQLYKVNRPQC